MKIACVTRVQGETLGGVFDRAQRAFRSDYMEEDATKQNPAAADFNKIDLSQLQGFSFGTQWTKDKASPGSGSSHSGRDIREDRQSAGPGGPDRRDRRAFKKPAISDAGSPGGPSRQPDRTGRQGPGERPAYRTGPYRGGGAPSERQERGPYDSPYFAANFFPEDASFNALVKTVRTSARTIELFEIARTVLDKPERFVVVFTRKPSDGPAKPIFVSVPDGLPFDTEDAAVAHVLGNHLATFFDSAEAEVEPPKGNFLVINRCGVTGELLGPPNYHRYTQLIQQHHASRLAQMPFEAFRARIETVRNPEVVAQWLDKMKKVTRFTWKGAVAEGQTALAFDSLEEARSHLLSNAKELAVRATDHARFHGKALEKMPRGEILAAIEGAYQRQLRFPLDTANHLRGRLRREHFTIFKKGSKGISYVCAVKRKFRVPGQVFAESVGQLIAFIEEHPMVKAGELAAKILGLSQEPGAVLAPAEREKVARIQGDLIWLVREGYVTEFIDGCLYAPPAMVEARKKEIEAEEVDPENFPEAVSAPEPAAAVPEVPLEVAPPSEVPVSVTSVEAVPPPEASTA